MFVIACILSIAVIWIFQRKAFVRRPDARSIDARSRILSRLKDMIVNVVGEHGYKYFPVVATFAVLVLISNLMGLFPFFMSPTASVNVTFALGITSFVYYNYVGIRENGMINHLAHFAGPKLPLVMALFITPLIFGIELVSNMIRPMTLGLRLFANMFADEQIALNVANLGFAVHKYFVADRFDAVSGFRGFCANACIYFAFDDLHQRSYARAARSRSRRSSFGSYG